MHEYTFLMEMSEILVWFFVKATLRLLHKEALEQELGVENKSNGTSKVYKREFNCNFIFGISPKQHSFKNSVNCGKKCEWDWKSIFLSPVRNKLNQILLGGWFARPPDLTNFELSLGVMWKVYATQPQRDEEKEDTWT